MPSNAMPSAAGAAATTDSAVAVSEKLKAVVDKRAADAKLQAKKVEDLRFKFGRDTEKFIVKLFNRLSSAVGRPEVSCLIDNIARVFDRIKPLITEKTAGNWQREVQICKELVALSEDWKNFDTSVLTEDEQGCIKKIYADFVSLSDKLQPYWFYQPRYISQDSAGGLRSSELEVVHSYRDAVIKPGKEGGEFFFEKAAWVSNTSDPLKEKDVVATVDGIEQRLLGNCYLVAALMSIYSVNPEVLRQLYRIQPDGTVIGRVYIRNDKNELIPQYFHFDNTQVQTVGAVSGIHYANRYSSHDWSAVNIAIKLFGLAQMHIQNINGVNEAEQKTYLEFLGDGLCDTNDVYEALLGTKPENIQFGDKPAKVAVLEAGIKENIFKHFAVSHEKISIMIALMQFSTSHNVGNKSGNKDAKEQEIDELIGRYFKGADTTVVEEMKAFSENFHKELEILKPMDKNPLRLARQFIYSAMVLDANPKILTRVDLAKHRAFLPTSLQAIADKIPSYSAETRVSLEGIMVEKFRNAIAGGDYVVLGTAAKADAVEGEGQGNSGEDQTHGIVHAHAYCATDIVRRESGYFLVMVNPWGPQFNYRPYYTRDADGRLKRHSNKGEFGLIDGRSYEDHQEYMFGAILDSANPARTHDSRSFEMPLDDVFKECDVFTIGSTNGHSTFSRLLELFKATARLLEKIRPGSEIIKSFLNVIADSTRYDSAEAHIQAVVVKLNECLKVADCPAEMMECSARMQALTEKNPLDAKAIARNLMEVISISHNGSRFSNKNIAEKLKVLPKVNISDINLIHESNQVWLKVMHRCLQQLITAPSKNRSNVLFCLEAINFQIKTKLAEARSLPEHQNATAAIQVEICEKALAVKDNIIEYSRSLSALSSAAGSESGDSQTSDSDSDVEQASSLSCQEDVVKSIRSDLQVLNGLCRGLNGGLVSDMAAIKQQRNERIEQVKHALAESPPKNMEYLKQYKRQLIQELKAEVAEIHTIKAAGMKGHLEVMGYLAKAKLTVQRLNDIENFIYTECVYSSVDENGESSAHLIADARFSCGLMSLIGELRSTYKENTPEKNKDLLQKLAQKLEGSKLYAPIAYDAKIDQLLAHPADLNTFIAALPNQPFVRDGAWNYLTLCFSNLEAVNIYDHCYAKDLSLTPDAIAALAEKEIQVFLDILGDSGASSIDNAEILAKAAYRINLKTALMGRKKGVFYSVRDAGNLSIPTPARSTLSTSDLLEQAVMDHPLIGLSGNMQIALENYQEQPFYKGAKPEFKKLCDLIVPWMLKGNRILPTQMITVFEFLRNAYLKQVYSSSIAEPEFIKVLETVHTGAYGTYAKHSYNADEAFMGHAESSELSMGQAELLIRDNTERDVDILVLSLVTPIAGYDKKAHKQTHHAAKALASREHLSSSSASTSGSEAETGYSSIQAVTIPLNVGRNLVWDKRALMEALPAYFTKLSAYIERIGYSLPKPLIDMMSYPIDRLEGDHVSGKLRTSPLSVKSEKVLQVIFADNAELSHQYKKSFELLSQSRAEIIDEKAHYYADNGRCVDPVKAAMYRSHARNNFLNLVLNPEAWNAVIVELKGMVADFNGQAKMQSEISAMIVELEQLSGEIRALPNTIKIAFTKLAECQQLASEFWYEQLETDHRSIELASRLPVLADKFSQIPAATKAHEKHLTTFMLSFACKSGKDRAGIVALYSTALALFDANVAEFSKKNNKAPNDKEFKKIKANVAEALAVAYHEPAMAGGHGATLGAEGFVSASKAALPDTFMPFVNALFTNTSKLHKGKPEKVEHKALRAAVEGIIKDGKAMLNPIAGAATRAQQAEQNVLVAKWLMVVSTKAGLKPGEIDDAAALLCLDLATTQPMLGHDVDDLRKDARDAVAPVVKAAADAVTSVIAGIFGRPKANTAEPSMLDPGIKVGCRLGRD